MIQSMKNGKHMTSSQLWAGTLCKNWGGGGKKEREIFPWTLQLISLHPEAWGFFHAGFFALRWYCYECYFCIYVLFGNLPGFFSNPLKSGNVKVWLMFKRIAHTKACRALSLSWDARSSFPFILHDRILFTGYYSLGTIHCTVLSEITYRSISKAWSTTIANQVLVNSLSNGKGNCWRVADAHVPACPRRTILRHCHSCLCPVQGIMSYISQKAEGSTFWCCTTVYHRCPFSHAG